LWIVTPSALAIAHSQVVVSAVYQSEGPQLSVPGTLLMPVDGAGQIG
jgi:hypothetical protein